MPSVYSTLSTSSGLLVFIREDDREKSFNFFKKKYLLILLVMEFNKINIPENSMTVDFECSYRNLKAGFLF